MKRLLLLAGMLVLWSATMAEEKERTWEGRWQNEKYGSSGDLTCTAGPKDSKAWKAKFQGKFRGRPFTHHVTFAARKMGEKTEFKGQATVRGDRYTWTGYTDGDTFYGKFRSRSGNHGDFRLHLVK